MPLDVLGCTRVTLTEPTSPSLAERSGKSCRLCRDGDSFLQLLSSNEEFLVSTSHQLVLITSLAFVHTARRSYRLDDPVKSSDWWAPSKGPAEKLSEPYHLEEGEVVTRYP